MAVVETTRNAEGVCRLRTSVSTTGVFIIGTLREYLLAGGPPGTDWQTVVHWSSHHPAFSRVAEELDALAVREALSLNIPEHEPRLLALCAAYAETHLLPLFRANPAPWLTERGAIQHRGDRSMKHPITALVLGFLPAVVWAHPGHGGTGFAAGFLHPVAGLDHLLAMLGVGFWASRQAIPGAAFAIGLAFLGAMLVAFAIGVGTTPQVWVELGILGSLAMIGGLLAIGRVPALGPSLALAVAFAIVHGHAHGAEMGPGQSAAAFAAGFLLTSALLLVCGAAAGRLATRTADGRVPQRVVGGLLVATAVYLLVVF